MNEVDGILFVCVTDATDHSSLFSGASVPNISAFTYSNPRADEATAQRNDDHLIQWEASMWAGVSEGHGPQTAAWNNTNPHGGWVAATEALVASTRPTNVLIDNVEILHHSQRRLVQ